MKTPKYITTEVHDGKEYFYFRRPGKPKIRIHGVPWTPSFMSQYQAALGGPNVVAMLPPEVPTQKTGNLSWLCDKYYDSAEFKELDAVLTKPSRTRLLNRICKLPTKPNSKILFGGVPVAQFTSKAVRVIRDRHADTPGTSRDMMKSLSALFSWAVEAECAEVNPVRDVKSLKSKSVEGFHTWPIEEVEQFEATHAVGTQERLAMGLLLYSSQRASDVTRFGPQHIKLRDGAKWLVFTQHKNRNRQPVHLEIPIRPELEALIDATPIGATTFLARPRGLPHSRFSFSVFFRKACIAAKVPGRSHGLRKAAAVRLAENGATDKEIMSITGHTTMQEVTRYTKAASQKRLAASATDKMKGK
jgi:integrase